MLHPSSLTTNTTTGFVTHNNTTMANNSNPKLLMVFIFSLMLTTGVKSDSLSFNYPSFTPGVRSILVDGEDATTTDGVLHLTKTDQSGTPIQLRSGLAAFFGVVHLSDKRTGKVADFATVFNFVVKTNGAQPHGDGFTFFLASLDYEFPDNSTGGFLGLFDAKNAFNASKNQVFAVEFDTFANDWDPHYPSFPHIGIDINTIRSVVTAPWPMDAQPDGAIGEARIIFKSDSKQLSVLVSYPNSPVKANATTLSYPINFANVLPEYVLVGFSASTGDLVETHDILSWYFTSSL